MSKENKNKEQTHITGTLRSAFTHEEKNEDGTIIKATHIITLSNDDSLSMDGSSADKVWEFFEGFFDGKPKKYIPNWFKDRSGITIKSNYNVPIRIADTDERLSFDEFVKRGLIRDAKVNVLCNIKDSALYPVAMQIDEDGVIYDAFENF